MEEKAERIEEVIYRICRVCGKSKPLTDFRRHKKSKLGRENICKKCFSAHRPANRECHKEEICQANKKYYDAHKKNFRDYNKKYKDKHKKETERYNKEYCREHKQEIASYGQEYRQTKKGAFLRACNQRRRCARKAEALIEGEEITIEQWQCQIKNQKYRCNLCDKKFTMSRPATMDHIWPLSKGGPHDSSNIQALCRSCNSSKNAKIMKSYINSWNHK